MQKIILIGLCIYLILLTSCETECPVIECPECKCPEPEVEDEGLYIYFINVWQGDSILIKHKDTEMLIDCGKNGQGPKVVSFLEEKDVTTLEYLLITHPASDHLGGCDDVLSHINTHTVITNGEKKDTPSYDEVMNEIDTEQLIIAQPGNEWNIGPAIIEVLQANNNLTDSNQNSIVLSLDYETTRALFTGDCEKECEDFLVKNKTLEEHQILKVARHGTKFGSEIDFLELIKPSVAAISVGTNSYGHPAQETLDRLSQQGINIYRTDIDGDITIRIDEKGYNIG